MSNMVRNTANAVWHPIHKAAQGPTWPSTCFSVRTIQIQDSAPMPTSLSHRPPLVAPHARIRPLAMSIALAFAGSAAHGQAAAPADAASGAEAGKLQTVTVTAQRITEDVK